MFRIASTYIGSDSGDVLYYDTPFYDVIRCNNKYNIVKNKKYNQEKLFDYCLNNE